MNILGYICSVDFIYMWIRVATPILLAALGSVVCSKAGVVNLGLEGTMLISALFGVLGSVYGNSLFTGLLAGLFSALLISAAFAYFHLILKANNVLCGTAVNTIATGLTVFVLQLATGEKGNSSSLKSFSFPNIEVPVIKDIPIIGEVISGHNALTYVALLLPYCSAPPFLFDRFRAPRSPLSVSVISTPSGGGNTRKIAERERKRRTRPV